MNAITCEVAPVELLGDERHRAIARPAGER